MKSDIVSCNDAEEDLIKHFIPALVSALSEDPLECTPDFICEAVNPLRDQGGMQAQITTNNEEKGAGEKVSAPCARRVNTCGLCTNANLFSKKRPNKLVMMQVDNWASNRGE